MTPKKSMSTESQDRLTAKDSRVIEWDRPKLERFKKVYSAAVAQRTNDDVFEFDGHEFNIKYAKYLIEYLDSRLAR